MSKRRRKHEDSVHPVPFQAWFLTVEKQHRLRISRDAGLVVSWLDASSDRIECVAAVGPAGGICIGPASSIEPLRRSIVTNLGGRSATPRESGSAWVAVERYLATSWALSVSVEATRFSLTLPKGARKLRLAPSWGETAVVFATEAIVEVWPREAWCKHIRHSAAAIDELQEKAIEELTTG